MRRVIIILAVLVILGAGGYGAYYYITQNTSSDSSGRVSSDSEDAVYVESVSAITGYGSGSGVLTRYGGEAVAQETLEITLDSERTLKECYVQEGDVVSKGQRLFVYDTQEDEDKIAQDEIDIEKNQMSIESNETSIEQQERLQTTAEDEDERTEAYLQVLSLQNEIRSYEYEIQKTQIEIDSLQETIDDAVVTAEMGGFVQKISDPDSSEDSYSSDTSAYITILAEGDYRIEGKVNELAYDDLDIGMNMIVYSRTDPSQTWKGTITDISEEKDEDNENSYYGDSSDSSNYKFYVELENADGLMLGQHVYLEEDAGQENEKSGLWLGEFYIMQEDGSAYVWLANSSNKIEKHEITLGDYDADNLEYEVTDGLTGEDYIAYPMEGISAGDPVYYSDLADVSDEDFGDEDAYGEDTYYGDEDYYEDDDDDDVYYYDDNDDLDWDDEDDDDDEDYAIDYYDDDDDDISYYDDDSNDYVHVGYVDDFDDDDDDDDEDW